MESVQQQAHIVLVHGTGHGAWCWFKLKPLLEAAGHRVTTFDLAASGIDSRQLEDLRSMDDYNQPLIDLLAAIPPSEKVLLVGHSFGGISLGLAMDKYPERIAAAVFVTAMMPDSKHAPSYVLEELSKRYSGEENWLDSQFSTFGNPEAPLSSYLFGPKCISDVLYSLCPPEDVELGRSLIRPSAQFREDLSQRKPLSNERFGSVKRVYITCNKDMAIPVSFQRWLVETIGVDEQHEIPDADHMAMVSTPKQLSQLLTQIAVKYAQPV